MASYILTGTAALPGNAALFFDGTGNWSTPSGGAPGGSSGQIQWNNSSVFDGVAGSVVTPTGISTIQAASGGLEISTTGTDDFTVNAAGTSILTVGGTGSGAQLASQNAAFAIDPAGDISVTAGNTNGSVTISSGATAGITITPGASDNTSITNTHLVGLVLDSTNSSGTTGQVLTTNGTVTTWQTPSFTQGSLSNTPVSQTARFTVGTVATGAIQGPYAVNFTTPFADNNYTVQVSIVGLEAAPGTVTLAAYPALGITYVAYQAGGAGVNVWIANNDSIVHTAYIQVTALHD